MAFAIVYSNGVILKSDLLSIASVSVSLYEMLHKYVYARDSQKLEHKQAVECSLVKQKN